jgi:hypothetical protein
MMKLGTAQIDITPQPGGELSGFAARVQPSTGVLDPLFAKALFIETVQTKLLWIHCDLIGFDRSIVLEFRRWARERFGLHTHQVMLSATHTHAGPATIHLRECGEYDAAYVELLQTRLGRAAEEAVAKTEIVGLTCVEGKLGLAVDRRKTATPHTDPRVVANGFRRRDGSFAAVLVNYAIHPVALGSTNRSISADILGEAALQLSRELPGRPVVLMTNGACGNLNPPAENVAFGQVRKWGRQIADAVQPLLLTGNINSQPTLQLLNGNIELPLETLDANGINHFADRALRNAAPLAEWGDKYRRVVEHWRSALLNRIGRNEITHHDAELFGVRLDDVIILGANAEVFSDFTDLLREKSRRQVYLVGYANGDVGYLPTRAAYAEGGYEVDMAHLFYGGFRPRVGGLELLAAAAQDLVRELEAKSANDAVLNK